MRTISDRSLFNELQDRSILDRLHIIYLDDKGRPSKLRVYTIGFDGVHFNFYTEPLVRMFKPSSNAPKPQRKSQRKRS